MEAALSPSMAAPSPPIPYQKTNLSPFYYSVVAIGSAAIVLVAYNLFIVGCCSQLRFWRWHDQNPSPEDTSLSLRNPHRYTSGLISSFKYRKGDEAAGDIECSVCLSVFEDGEDVRQLPLCKHLFHAPCIDMWLYSHSNCPLCRAAL
ncbi:PREDICTED: RING-H2 finger protein ATL52-like [Nelumbo nucifera]|uniref:RING-type E3 ubiquitin transferase n=1 Tax=Nelumbo nucifera TaxID=4432 RepID=A0A1U8Q4X0_NELNU|nr:PREDICTED: RING-H2 finger protein ATL52-like [Nelumbo nucifera]